MSRNLTLATWNVNGIRARLERVSAWLEQVAPDVLVLQETKVEDQGFPAEAFASLGYQVAFHGQKAYNGVALLARGAIEAVERGFADGGDDSQARLISGVTAGLVVVSAYVPNGQSVGSEKFAYKLEWLGRLERWLARRLEGGRPLVLLGDFNVAPASIDVHDPQAWEGKLLVTPEERRALEEVRATGLVDLLRHLHPNEKIFSWWDYRQLAFPKNQGLRIDHVLVTADLAERAVSCRVDRDARKGKQPSDHAPVVAELRLSD